MNNRATQFLDYSTTYSQATNIPQLPFFKMATPASRTSSETLRSQHDAEDEILLEKSGAAAGGLLPSWYPSSSSRREEKKAPRVGTVRLLVAWLGILTFISGGLVVYNLSTRFGDGGSTSNTTTTSALSAAPASPPAPAPPGTTTLAEPIILGDCGNSVEEAQAKGCIFDVMAFTWEPPECYDAELVAEFLDSYDWKFYRKWHGKEEDLIPWEESSQGLSDVWSPWIYHTLHCTFQWRKFHRAWAAGAPIDSATADYNHTRHCESQLWKGEYEGNDVINTLLELRFLSCGYFVSPGYHSDETFKAR